ncbi:MAG: Na/Pi cotransporter family protein [Nitrospirae bacterium]|nr:Na/Pi cotransporter family protein [Nitrospirota bacterium]
MTLLTFITLLGGVALLLYGMRLAGQGFQEAAGGRLRAILSSLTKNRFMSVGVGALITAILQSSSATTVMLVGFVSSGVMRLNQTIGVILGADIGTTITVQILAFHVYDAAIFFIAIGVAVLLLAKRSVVRDIGQGILGFAFIFYSIKLMSEAAAPLRDSEGMRLIFASVEQSPLLGLVAAAILTAMVQSSAAVIGMTLALALQDLITIQMAIPIIFGANIGTCAMAIISSVGANVEARQVAAAHTMFKVLGVLIFYPLMGPFGDLVQQTSSDVAREIANAHTFFNVAIALLFLPFTESLANFIRKIVPEREGAEKFGPRYLDERVLSSPPLALGQATREALRMADIVQWMLKESLRVFRENNRDLLERIERRDDELDLLDQEIKRYLTRLSQSTLAPSQSKKEMELIAFTSNLENMGDIIDKNLMELGKKKINQGVSFSEEGLREICEFHERVVENFELAVSAFAGRDQELAQKILRHKTSLSETERTFRQSHINRLHKGLRESMDTSSIHLDILSNLKRINSHITNIAYPILEEGKE